MQVYEKATRQNVTIDLCQLSYLITKQDISIKNSETNLQNATGLKKWSHCSVPCRYLLPSLTFRKG